MNAGVLTISDGVSRGEREDTSGPGLTTRLQEKGWTVARHGVVSDEQAEIETKLGEWVASGDVDLILTTGGTGVAPRDHAPEATLAVIERQVPGLQEAMRAAGLKSTPHSMLSRGLAGIRGRTLIVNLPGSPRGALENLNVILPVLPHAVGLLRDEPEASKSHRVHDPGHRA